MLDKRFILENADLVQKNCDDRGSKVDVPRFVALETKRREMQTQVEEISRQANLVSKSIGKAADDAEREERKAEGRRLRDEKDKLQVEIDLLGSESGAIHRSIPNLSHPETPIGGEDACRELRHGATEVTEFGFPTLDHVELSEQHDLIDC